MTPQEREQALELAQLWHERWIGTAARPGMLVTSDQDLVARALLAEHEAREDAERDAVAVREKMHHNAANLDWCIEQRQAAEQKVEALRAALGPFARAGGRLLSEGTQGYRDGRYDERHETFRFRVGDVITARRALADGGGE